MDRQLISLKFAMLRHTSAGMRPFGWAVGGVLVAATWAAVVFAAGDEVRSEVTMLLLAAWGVGAALGPVLTSGSGVLKPDYFALLPIERRVIGRGLLVSAFVGVASGYVLLATLATAVHAVWLSPATLLVAAVGAPLTWVLVITASRLVYGLLGAAMRSRFGVEIAAIQFGLMFAVMFTGWMVVQVAVQSVPALLGSGLPNGPITAVLGAFPTSWPVLAIESAAAGEWGVAALLLLALAAVDAVVVISGIALLSPRATTPSRGGRGRARSAGLVAGGGILPRTQLGAVIGKEMRQWTRDPWRSLEIRSGVWTGIAIGFFAWVSGIYAGISAFAGLIVAFMLGLAACNLYGQDGTAVWQNVVGQDKTSVRSDVRGRQWATILVFVPQAILISAIFLLLSQQFWALPTVLAAMPAVFGAASGAAVLVSALGVSPGVDPRMRVGPNDANGNISLHVWVVMVLIAVGVAPTGAAIVLSFASGLPWIVTVLVGFANGWLAAWLLGRVTIAWLTDRMPDVYSRIRYGRIFRAGDQRGILAWIERTTLRGEQRMQEQRQKAREERVKATS